MFKTFTFAASAGPRGLERGGAVSIAHSYSWGSQSDFMHDWQLQFKDISNSKAKALRLAGDCSAVAACDLHSKCLVRWLLEFNKKCFIKS